MNIFGPSKAFLPLIFIDSFLLALLSIIFFVLPKFSKFNLIFFVLAIVFLLKGLFATRIIQSSVIQIVVEVIFISTCGALFFIQLFKFKKITFLSVIPLCVFIFSFLLGFFSINLIIIMILIGSGFFVMTYSLARPDLLEDFTVSTKRFYLLMSLMLFYDLIFDVFILLNPVQDHFK